jgi:hypothetical protein
MSKKAKTKVKKIALQRGHVARIAIPKGHAPVIATDAERGVVEVVPVPVESKKETWWDYFFGPDE